ncbi:MAG: hypothetical protein DRJ61_07055 [Acidobacteria bacterium]|nr:MAG: hypothetical protein DRJ61_07055 [Acidobacteriota bacterium]
MDRNRFNGLRQRWVGLAPIIGLALLCFTGNPALLWAQVPPNDLCADAISIDCAQNPFGTLGTNVDASATGAPFCGTSPGNQAVWYSVMGNGFEITVDTCSPTTVFDTKINVFTGDCMDEPGMICIGGNDDAVGNPLECDLGGLNRLSRISWTSVDSVEYLIVVSGFNNATGAFELTLTCEVPVELQRFTVE